MPAIIHDFVRYNENVIPDFKELINSRLPDGERRLIQLVADEAARRHLPLYAVGGLPRDLWLGRAPADLDLVVEGEAIELARALASQFGGRVTGHVKFGTAKWDLRTANLPGRADDTGRASAKKRMDFLDLVAARSESYGHPGALPTVRSGTIRDDIRRRDFTINTLALRLDGAHFGEVIDEFGAFKDLQAGVVRVLHPLSFRDDPTRMYRAVRYENRFSFEISSETLALVPPAARYIAALSGQRIRHELDLILDEPGAGAMLGRLGRLALLGPIHRALPHDQAAIERVKLVESGEASRFSGCDQDRLAWMLWLITLPEAQIRSIVDRLRMTREDAVEIAAAARLYRNKASIARGRPSRITATLDEYPESAIVAASLVVDGKTSQCLHEYLRKWKNMRPMANGGDLRRLGVPPGPAYGRILAQLRAAWLDGRIVSGDEERRWLQKWAIKAARPAGGAAKPRAGSRVKARPGKGRH